MLTQFLKYYLTIIFGLILMATACTQNTLPMTIYETSASGNHLKEITPEKSSQKPEYTLTIDTSITYQTITGFGGSFTESSAYLLNKLSAENRKKIIEAYFGESGAKYSLTRTHINSCDFSLDQYSYAPIADDMELKYFSIEADKDDIIPMIKDAQRISKDGFKIISSPWTAPPWMKDNKAWVGGKLLPEYYAVWARFFSKYIEAYALEGIDIWGVTVENEPHGNGNNWESMHYSPEEMTTFVKLHLGPQLEKDGKSDIVILGYDQNRAGIKEWVDVMYADEASAKYYDGTAIHWYESTYEVFPEDLRYAHEKAPNKYLIQTEACVDAEVPHWKDDAWYWKKEATDWGWDWAPEEQKYLHPKYAPVHRYVRDIIGCLNNWVDGWVDWNMVLDRQGGPNWFKNWCVAPVIVDPDKDEVYFTPIYYALSHFSRFIRPGSRVVKSSFNKDVGLMALTTINTDGSEAITIFNEHDEPRHIDIKGDIIHKGLTINPQSLLTIILKS